MNQIHFFGLFFPALLLIAIGAIGIAKLLRRLLASAGIYRWVWHPPLFDLALDVLVFCAAAQVVSIFQAMA
jgi:hypothetical protein